MTFGKISVLVPTRKRPDRLRKMLESFQQTNDGKAELVFRVDEDDLETGIIAASGRHVVVVGPRMNGYSSMSVFMNEAFAAAHGDVLMCGNDDMVFKTAGWPSLVLEAANQFPDGLFDIGVTTYNEDHYPFWIVSRLVADHLGFVLDPRIYWGDIFWRDVMGQFGRCVKLPTVEIEHDWAGHVPDTTFTEAKQHEIWQRDPTYWAGTHTTAVNEVANRLRELQCQSVLS